MGCRRLLRQARRLQEGKKYPMILKRSRWARRNVRRRLVSRVSSVLPRAAGGVLHKPASSTGYGEKFERGIVGEWGGKDYQDVMNGR